MTLILATLTPKGIVLAADRRTVTFNTNLREDRILTDEAEKIIIGDNIAIAVVGENTDLTDTSEHKVREWLMKTYSSTQSTASQVRELYSKFFASGARGGFVAAFIEDNNSTIIFTKVGEALQTQIVSSKDNSVLKFFGSGNLIASNLVVAEKPKLNDMDLEKLRSFSAEIIEKTHCEMIKDSEKLASVGPNVMAAIIDKTSVQLQYKED